ncbi:MAG: hypothetical protein HQ494_05680 [Rhodospirillales bacterium]|nr:hypothetical protein [Rhodospirillales bacterium]
MPFSDEDFLGIYQVEGLAYQYWRTTALMRSLGKGCGIVLDAKGEWKYWGSKDLFELIKSIDERTDSSPFETSLVGVWFSEEKSQHENSQKTLTNNAIGTIYNLDKIEIPDFFAEMGLEIEQGFTPNFIPVLFDLGNFLTAHQFMANAFEKRNGVSLEVFIGTIWALSNTTALLGPTPEEEKEDKKALPTSLMNLIQRGYKVVDFNIEEMGERLLPAIKIFLPNSKFSSDDVACALDKLTFTPNMQNDVSLWSGGPRSVIIPYNSQAAILDFQGIPSLLFTLFCMIAHDSTKRGSVFEETFRLALKNRGYNVIHGELKQSKKLMRELDAGVRIGNKLILFECVSIERPLDYEIGRPVTFANRQARLEKKISQVLSLADFITKHSKGNNFDFSWAEEIVSLVVTPSIEWAWGKSDELWLSDGTPRMLSASEAISFLERHTPNN